MQLQTDLTDEINLEDRDVIPTMLTSTIVHKNILVKILRNLELILDEEFNSTGSRKEYDERFMVIIKALTQKKISEAEFFEEDEIVRRLCKKIFGKLVRNFSMDFEAQQAVQQEEPPKEEPQQEEHHEQKQEEQEETEMKEAEDE